MLAHLKIQDRDGVINDKANFFSFFLNLQSFLRLPKFWEMESQEHGCDLLYYIMVWLIHISECQSSQQWPLSAKKDTSHLMGYIETFAEPNGH